MGRLALLMVSGTMVGATMKKRAPASRWGRLVLIMVDGSTVGVTGEKIGRPPPDGGGSP